MPMSRWMTAVLAVAATASVACSQLRPVTPTEIPTVAAEAAGAGAATAVAAAQRLSGQVQSVADGKVTLANGSTFTLAPDARIVRAATAQLGELQPGQVVA